jgi:TctA family transporter
MVCAGNLGLFLVRVVACCSVGSVFFVCVFVLFIYVLFAFMFLFLIRDWVVTYVASFMVVWVSKSERIRGSL